MKNLSLMFALIFIVDCVAVGQDCSQFNKNVTPYPIDFLGFQSHNNGRHEFITTLNGSCTYSGSTPGQACSSTCTSSGSGWINYELGSVTPVLYHHEVGSKTNTEQAQAPNGGPTQCAATAAAAVNTCLISCAVAISFSGNSNGIGIGISFPPQAIFENNQLLTVNCAAKTLPTGAQQCTGNPQFVCCSSNGGAGSPSCVNGQWSCPGSTCDPNIPPPSCTAGTQISCVCGGGWVCTPLPGTPIVIDSDGSGFHLTSATDGVRFDIKADGKPIQIAWTAAGSRNAWLALPDSDGTVTSGKQLFGNVTPQPTSPEPNGFLALAVYDQPDKGGNGDGVIDWKDAIWPKLRLWIDSNHDGVAQTRELHTLPSLGVTSLGLTYRESKFEDQYGNEFRYKGKVNPDGQPPDDHVGRVMYDVFLSTPTVAVPHKQKLETELVEKLD